MLQRKPRTYGCFELIPKSNQQLKEKNDIKRVEQTHTTNNFVETEKQRF